MKFLKYVLFSLSLMMASTNVWASLVPVQPIEPTQNTRHSTEKLTRQERQTMRQELKTLKKQHKKSPDQTKQGNKVLAIIFAILIPFVGVLIWDGGITLNFWIDLLLCILLWLPGIIFALLVVFDVVNLAK